MTFKNLYSGLPARRAASLFHLGRDLTHAAKVAEVRFGLSDNQNNVLGIFLGEVKKAHTRAVEETARD